MAYNELYELLSIKYNFVNRPSNEELQKIANEILQLSKEKAHLSDEDLDRIIRRNVVDLEVYAFESVDMTDSINIIQQILVKLQATTNG